MSAAHAHEPIGTAPADEPTRATVSLPVAGIPGEIRLRIIAALHAERFKVIRSPTARLQVFGGGMLDHDRARDIVDSIRWGSPLPPEKKPGARSLSAIVRLPTAEPGDEGRETYIRTHTRDIFSEASIAFLPSSSGRYAIEECASEALHIVVQRVILAYEGKGQLPRIFD